LGTPANIDSVLREILEAEVEVHQATLQDWLRSAQQAPQPVSDALLRAVHTMNGAFAMTEVPEITAVTGGAESYIKRALAADVVPGDEGVAALDATAQAITATMEALQAEQPRIAPQEALVQRLQALAGELPEARWPMVGLEDEDEELALEPGRQAAPKRLARTKPACRARRAAAEDALEPVPAATARRWIGRQRPGRGRADRQRRSFALLRRRLAVGAGRR
jgi:chemosensory pili system protein ChpA (sensor histidine kinase/response regulator)